MPRPERPIVGGQRPGFQNRPGINNRPIVNRPIIGGGNVVNRPGGNININRPNVNIHRPIIGNPVNTRPGWGIDPGFNRPHWGNDWHNNYVRPHHHGWYHGCWHGHWHNYWYVPLAVGATAWTLNAFTSSWGYGPTYYNPYYIEPAASVVAPYDYSQPIVVNNYTSTGEGAGEVPAAESPQSQAVLATFDEALAFFKNGEYTRALAKVTVALQKDSTDPVMHEFRALCLFAQGEYKQSAAALNSLLAVAPGMDWTTVSGLYGNVDDYSKQLRRLEDHCEKQTKDSAAFFVLAYHYLVLGHTDDAIKTLQTVVQLQPKDATAQRMLAGLSPPKEEEPDKPQPKDAQPEEPQTDLVGAWKSSAGSTTIELTISEDSTFTWKASTPGQTAKEVKGSVNIAADILSLETEKDGAMVGTVKSGGADRFTFRMQGTLPSDPALTFARMK
jgi:tetratricopeptide (TPR) repeat protein